MSRSPPPNRGVFAAKTRTLTFFDQGSDRLTAGDPVHDAFLRCGAAASMSSMSNWLSTANTLIFNNK